MSKEIMFFRIYQDKSNIEGNSYVADKAELKVSLEHWAASYGDDENGFPVIEPVLMTQEEFYNLPKFTGY